MEGVLVVRMTTTLLLVVLLFAVSGCTTGTTTEPNTTTEPSTQAEPKEAELVPETPAEESTLTMEQEQAVTKGREYLDFASFSRQGLIDQLVYEGFSTEDAAFATDEIAPDWDAQAAQKAAEYLDISAFSRQGLIDQLVFEGFTQAQAEHGAQAVGY